MKIVVILGTSRVHNKSQFVARYVLDSLSNYAGLTVTYLNLGEQLFPPMLKRYSEENESDQIRPWVEKIEDTNGIVIIAPEYKNGYPGVLKNFLDYLPSGILKYKPVGIVTVSSGPGGGSNCLAQLRLVVISMGGIVIPDRFQVANVHDYFNEHIKELPPKITIVATKFMSEFINYCKVFLKDC